MNFLIYRRRWPDIIAVCLKIVMIISFFLISPITTAEQSIAIPPIIVKRPTSSSPSLTREQITQSGAITLSQVLQQLGGVQLQDTSGNGSQVLISMRGFGTNATSNTLLLINGIPFTNPDMAPPDLNVIPLESIESVEIVTGSESVLYGDQAVGGIINIMTDEQTKNKIETACNAGSYNQHACHAALYNHYGSFNYHLAIDANKTNNYREHNHYQQVHLSGGFKQTYQYDKLNFLFHLLNENMEYPGALTAAQVRQNRRQASNAIDYFRDTNGFLQLQHLHEINADWRLDTQFAYRDMHGVGVLFSPFNQSRSIYFIKPTIKGKLYGTDIVGGIEAEADRYRLNSLLGLTEDRQQKYAGFALATLPIYRLLNLSLGARGALQSSRVRSFLVNHNNNRAFASTLGLHFQLLKTVQAYLRRAESYRFPKADENAFAEPANGLRTQRGAAYEGGIKWEDEKQAVQFALYQLNLKDEIMFDPLQTAQDPFGTNRNLAPTVRRGFSLSGKEYLTQKLRLDGQYNYVNARFQNASNADNRIPLVAENLLRAGMNYAFSDNWNFYTEAIFTGNQYAANDNANIAGKIGGYTVYNLNIRYLYKQFSASLHVNNIFNRYYYFYTVFQSGMNSEFFYPAPGRNMILSFNYLFE